MKRVLFVCVENSNRSQMAQAFARIHGQGRVEAFSAGSRPSGRVNPKAIQSMRELNYDLATLEATAGSEAIQLAGVYRLNPAWIYQGETVTEIVKDGLSSLRACGLNGAAAELARATRVHPSG